VGGSEGVGGGGEKDAIRGRNIQSGGIFHMRTTRTTANPNAKKSSLLRRTEAIVSKGRANADPTNSSSEAIKNDFDLTDRCPDTKDHRVSSGASSKPEPSAPLPSLCRWKYYARYEQNKHTCWTSRANLASTKVLLSSGRREM